MMTAWPHKGRLSVFAEAEPVTQPMDVPGSDVPVPPVAAIAQTPMEIAEEALLIAPPAMDVAAAPGQRRLRRRWLIPAAMLSGVAHAAAIFALVNWLDLRSVEADADEVSIEIVIEPPETAGARVQQQSQLAETEAEPPPGFQPPDPFAPELAKVPDFPQPREPAIITPEMPDMIVGPPSMPPVRTFVLPTPHTLAVLAAPPRFEPAVSGARPELPVTSGAGRPEPQARSSARAQTTKPAPMAEPLHKKPEPDADKKTRRTEPKNAGKPAKERREARKDKTQEKKTEVARGGGQPAAGSAGKGSGAKDRRQGEAGKAASAASGGVAQYGAQVNRHVQRFRRYPAEAERAGIKGVVRVSIRIDSSGRLSSASVRAGSGHVVLDREALATVKRASPYPKPPAGVAPASFSLTLRFSR